MQWRERSCEAPGIRFVKPVFERLTAIDKHHRYFVGELAPQAIVTLNVNFAPIEASPAFELGQLLFDDLAEVATFSGVHDNFALLGHRRESSKTKRTISTRSYGLATAKWTCPGQAEGNEMKGVQSLVHA